ncbi:hypothetical protein Y032_0010g1065 [Ancylostoma ceylanicum]|uniref:Uncharacterized protein n=1 Tax=Ancylostoma ceylanicum TaxID=53326 RepID=A0A016VGX2_9BILA|nr:hypothetical protein Y032_0010g1065 [Ancylostoma ceylanicum]
MRFCRFVFPIPSTESLHQVFFSILTFLDSIFKDKSVFDEPIREKNKTPHSLICEFVNIIICDFAFIDRITPHRELSFLL